MAASVRGAVLAIVLLLALIVLYLIHINRILLRIPDEAKSAAGSPWTAEQLKRLYDELEKRPIDYTASLPPRLDRRYIVTGGNGLVGGFIVLHLLARGTPPGNIRILDLREPQRADMLTGPAREVEAILLDIRSATAVNAAFSKSWHRSVAHLPLTVFHTAAVILASDRSRYLYDFPHAVNVQGTLNVLVAAKAAGASVFSATSSASISIRPIDPWVSFTAKEPREFLQILDTRDFDRPMRKREEFYSNYPITKALAEREICNANEDKFRTGCIRPANGVYGNPTDNPIGGLLGRPVMPTWVPHFVQSFVHGGNVALAHLQHEAVLLSASHVAEIPQAGRPFVVTDPNPPIIYNNIYAAMSTLSIHPFTIQAVSPVLILLVAYIFEWYQILPYRFPFLKGILPPITGDARSLQPPIFSICTHLIADDSEARKPSSEGGLGYQGVLTTMQGIVLEILEWNREHLPEGEQPSVKVVARERKKYTTSVMLAEQIRQAVGVGADS